MSGDGTGDSGCAEQLRGRHREGGHALAAAAGRGRVQRLLYVCRPDLGHDPDREGVAGVEGEPANPVDAATDDRDANQANAEDRASPKMVGSLDPSPSSEKDGEEGSSPLTTTTNDPTGPTDSIDPAERIDSADGEASVSLPAATAAPVTDGAPTEGSLLHASLTAAAEDEALDTDTAQEEEMTAAALSAAASRRGSVSSRRGSACALPNPLLTQADDAAKSGATAIPSSILIPSSKRDIRMRRPRSATADSPLE